MRTSRRRLMVGGAMLLGAAAWPAAWAQADGSFDHGYATWDGLLKKHVRWLPDNKQTPTF